MKKNFLRSLFGIICFSAAIICIGLAAGFFELEFNPIVLFSLILIVPMAIWVAVSGVNAINSIGTALGFGLALLLGGWFSAEHILLDIITVFLIFAGVLLWGGAGREPFDIELLKKQQRKLTQETVLLKAVFVNSNNKNTAQNITGGIVQANMCDIAYDLSSVSQSHSVEIEANAVLGNLLLIIPKDCRMQLHATNSFGKVINRFENQEEASDFTLTIKAKATFGKIIIQ